MHWAGHEQQRFNLGAPRMRIAVSLFMISDII